MLTQYPAIGIITHYQPSQFVASDIVLGASRLVMSYIQDFTNSKFHLKFEGAIRDIMAKMAKLIVLSCISRANKLTLGLV